MLLHIYNYAHIFINILPFSHVTHYEMALRSNLTSLTLKFNLTHKEHIANGRVSKYLIIISNSDKGGAVVVIDTDSYIKETNQQLSDKTNYKQLTPHVTNSFIESLPLTFIF